MKPQRKPWILLVLAVLLAALLIARARPARADIAPPPPPEGASISPGSETTQVRMLAETVIIEVANNAYDQPARARVRATFQMRNLGEQEERMQVRFPLNVLYPMNQSDVNTCVYPLAAPEISDFTARVDGRPVPVQNTIQTLKDEFRDLPPKKVNCWANFAVIFPVQQDVTIEVAYSVEGYKSQLVDGQVSFPYVLLTGAAWKGTIGSVEVILRAPFELTPQTLVYAYPEAEVRGSELRWVYLDFEPDGNVEAAIVNPGLWQRILREQDTLAKDPADGEAWGRLGRWYKEAIRLRRGFRDGPGAEEMYALSKAAYGKAVALKPNDADWHAGYGELLCWNHFYPSFGSRRALRDDLVGCLQEVRLALALNPRQAKALEMIEGLSWESPERRLIEIQGESVTYLALTTTPTARPEDTATPQPSSTAAATMPATNTALPTATEIPPPAPTASTSDPVAATADTAATASPAATAVSGQDAKDLPAPAPSGGLCSAALIPLAGVGILRIRKRQKSRVE